MLTYLVFLAFESLFILRTEAIPSSWVEGYNRGSFLYSTKEKPANVPQIGNGYVATYINTQTEYLAGVFNGIGTKTPSHRARIPASSNLGVAYGGPTGKVLSPTAWGLDLKTAIAYKLYSVGKTNITQSWYANHAIRHAIIMTLEIDNSEGTTAETFTTVDMGGGISKDIKILNTTKTKRFSGWLATTIEREEPTSPLTTICAATGRMETVTVGAGEKKSISILSVRYTSLSGDHVGQVLGETPPELWTICEEGFQNISAVPPKVLRADHEAVWARLWESRIEIEGDMQLARVVNASIYALLNGIRNDWAYSTSPGGLPTDGYNGHTFWDVETWMYPTVALLWPDIAEGSMIQYRFQRIPGAEKKAAKNHYKGAMFPWESAFTGQEVCPAWAPTGIREQHITGDVALAVWQYYALGNAHNTDWLNQVGWPMFYKMSEFWASRVSGNSKIGYSINDVIPPDEYHDHVNNSVYTNVGARLTFEFLNLTAKAGDKKYPSHWNDIKDNLIVLLDKKRESHPEFEGYFSLAPKHQIVKQADVILLPYPLQWPMDKQVAKNDLDWYGPKTDPNGPAMTWSMFCVGYLAIGEEEQGHKYFTKGYKQYVQAPFNEWWEVRAGSGTRNFITGVGGFLQSLYAGYFGLRISGYGTITVDPPNTLQPGVNGIKLKGVTFYGNELTLENNGKQKMLSVSLTKAGTVTVVGCQQHGHPMPLPLELALPLKSPLRLVAEGDC
eukprot:TRINITY_DN75100_c0_g1_i1.p1 TRINITY_DN75100_c0_g1~~TRINITY_DN75100_c0_g1_i1.p1  ORF type:complete len:728 (-),score=42.74 TRINITY_DN75100_c0_g1_i1:23-2206(-)